MDRKQRPESFQETVTQCLYNNRINSDFPEPYTVFVVFSLKISDSRDSEDVLALYETD